MLAPIIVFAFNRPEALKNTIQSLLENEEAKDSDLYVFVDGARPNKPEEGEKVNDVQEYVKNIKGFKSIHHTFSEVNKGLGNSIIQGVTQVINIYGNAIIVEDDLVFATNFLSYMNQGLERYEKEEKVFSICGYSNKVKVPKGYEYDTYFCTRSSSWGWGTWADRWNSVDWELKNWDKYSQMGRAFNKWGGSDCWKMLNDWKHGKNKSWAIRFCFAQFLQDKVSLFPTISKVRNDGFDGEGTNCKKWSRFKFEFDKTKNKTFAFPLSPEIDFDLFHSAMSYHSIAIRIWSKIMYQIYR
ncbi:glycosyltransferase [Mediterranea massiliensis]|uniref:glycosyltransferase n=1 Tax=Mediterranea massiliensis TaxID=1841865 RepID=UPI0023F17BA5|nr:glycosyltransferase [Mediterranea massiliensis]